MKIYFKNNNYSFDVLFVSKVNLTMTVILILLIYFSICLFVFLIGLLVSLHIVDLNYLLSRWQFFSQFFFPLFFCVYGFLCPKNILNYSYQSSLSFLIYGLHAILKKGFSAPNHIKIFLSHSIFLCSFAFHI